MLFINMMLESRQKIQSLDEGFLMYLVNDVRYFFYFLFFVIFYHLLRMIYLRNNNGCTTKKSRAERLKIDHSLYLY